MGGRKEKGECRIWWGVNEVSAFDEWEGREDREKKGRVLSGGRGCVLGRMSEFTGGNRGGERR